ncbi:MAG: hypothetical protein AAF585_07800, partial [Verrucomicrobiota bacterium]
LRSAQSGLTVVLEGEDGELELVLEPQASTLTGETVGDTSEGRSTFDRNLQCSRDVDCKRDRLDHRPPQFRPHLRRPRSR